MENQPVSSSCSIVLLGQFNPAIFHPSWLEAKGIEKPESVQSDSNLFNLIAICSLLVKSPISRLILALTLFG